MDSITQAALGALCGELVLGKKLGNYGILWGALFGTLPDLDIIAYPFLSASEQLAWHRGISHSVLMIFIATFFFGWLIQKFYEQKEPYNALLKDIASMTWYGRLLSKLYHYREPDISFKRASLFVFLAWSTHVWIDCFNTYGTMILEPFSSDRIAMNNIFIIDLFFLVPILLCIIFCITFFRKNPVTRIKLASLTAIWLCGYFSTSLIIKQKANQHFESFLADKGISKSRMVTAPTFSNIFLWRMIAEDTDGETIHTSYWSFFDKADTKYKVLSITKDHHLEADFKDSEDLRVLTWFTDGWHKTYQDPAKPNTIYIAAMKMGEIQIPTKSGHELRPAFIWSITRNGDGSYELGRAFKLSKDGAKHMKKAVGNTINRVTGDNSNWLQGDIQWTWDMLEDK